MPAATAITAIVLAGLDAYDAVARRRGIATLDPDAREEAVKQAVRDSELKYAEASADLEAAITESRDGGASNDDGA